MQRRPCLIPTPTPTTINTQVSYLSRAQKTLLFAGLAVVAACLCATVAVPALLFFPVTFLLVSVRFLGGTSETVNGGWLDVAWLIG